MSNQIKTFEPFFGDKDVIKLLEIRRTIISYEHWEDFDRFIGIIGCIEDFMMFYKMTDVLCEQESINGTKRCWNELYIKYDLVEEIYS